MLNDWQVELLRPIGRWIDGVAQRRSTPEHKAKKTKNKTKTIFEHERQEERENTALGGGSEPRTRWLGSVMMDGSEQTACWAIM